MTESKVPVQWESKTELPGTPKPVNHATEPIDNLHLSEGIPSDVLKMFEIDLMTTDTETLNKIREISEWALDGQTFVGDGMMKLKNLIESMPTQMRGKHESIWNHIKLQKRIEGARKELHDLELRKIAIYGDGRPQMRPY